MRSVYRFSPEVTTGAKIKVTFTATVCDLVRKGSIVRIVLDATGDELSITPRDDIEIEVIEDE